MGLSFPHNAPVVSGIATSKNTCTSDKSISVPNLLEKPEERTDLARNVDQQPYDVGRVQIRVPRGTEPARELIDGLLPRGRGTWPKLTSIVTFPLDIVLAGEAEANRQVAAEFHRPKGQKKKKKRVKLTLVVAPRS